MMYVHMEYCLFLIVFFSTLGVLASIVPAICLPMSIVHECLSHMNRRHMFAAHMCMATHKMSETNEGTMTYFIYTDCQHSTWFRQDQPLSLCIYVYTYYLHNIIISYTHPIQHCLPMYQQPPPPLLINSIWILICFLLLCFLKRTK